MCVSLGYVCLVVQQVEFARTNKIMKVVFGIAVNQFFSTQREKKRTFTAKHANQ